VSGAVTAHHRDGFVDLGALSVVKASDVALDLSDQVPDPGDLLLGGGGVGTGPFVDTANGGGQSFPRPEQVLEVCLQVGQESDVGAEMVAARAAEPDRAGTAASLDIGGLGAGAVRDGDFPDRVAGPFGVQEGAGYTGRPLARCPP
jgi:hypothetical protein